MVTDDEVRSHLTPHRALLAMRQCFTDLVTGIATDEPRHRMPLGAGSFNAMWAASESLGTLALKAYSVVRGDVRQATEIHVFLFDVSTGALHTTMRGDALGQLRTGAVSVLAAQQLGMEQPKALAVFGTGYQAEGQVRAALDQFPSVEQVWVVSRSPSAGHGFAVRTRSELGDRQVEVIPTDAETAVRNSTLIVTATASSEPLFDGNWIQPGTHVNAVGSNHRSAREIDACTVSRASTVVVDSRVAAHREAGDLIINGFDPGCSVELGELLTASEPFVRAPGDITVFTSHGLAVQDLYAASAVLANRSEQRAAFGDLPSASGTSGVPVTRSEEP